MTGSSLQSSQSRTKLAPMNPAPPVTKIMRAPCAADTCAHFYQGRGILSCAPKRFACAVVLPIPLYEAGEPDMQRSRRCESGGCGESLYRRKRRGHVPWLHWLVLPDCAHAEEALQLADERFELDGGVVPDVIDRAGCDARRRCCRRPRQDAHDTLDNVVDVGKVALHPAKVEDLDRTTLKHGAREQHRRHVRPPPGSVDGEKTQRCRR